MKKLPAILSPFSAAALIYGWFGVLSNSNTYSDILIPLVPSIAIFLIGVYGMFRSLCGSSNLRGGLSTLLNISLMSVIILTYGVGPIYLLATSPNLAMPAWWIALGSIFVIMWAMDAPRARNLT